MKAKILAWLDLFVIQLRADGRSQHTIGQYERHVRLLAEWVREHRVRRLDHRALARFLTSDAARLRPDGGQKKATSVNALRTSLRCFFAYLHSAGEVRENPARLVRRARCGSVPPRCLSEAEQKRLLGALGTAKGAAEERDRVLFHLLLATGLRIGSALALDAEDVDLQRGELSVRHAKGDRPDLFPLDRRTRQLLRRHLAGRRRGPLFPGPGGARITRRHAARRLGAWTQRAAIHRRISPHDLRHTVAVRVLDKTGDVFAVKEVLGHRNVTSSILYLEARRTRARRTMIA